MKKVMPVLFAATLVSSSFGVYAQAAEGEQTTVVDQTNGETTTEETTGPQQVEKLTLDDVIKRGTENNKNLAVLQLNLEATKNQLLDTQFDENDAVWDAKDLEDKIDDLKDARKDLKDTSDKIANGQERIAINDALDKLEEQIQSLQLAIKKLESGQLQLQLQEGEAKEGVRLLLTSSYTNILLLQDQIDFTKKAIQSASAEVHKAQRMYDFGTGSKEDIRQAQVAETNLKKQLQESEKNYNHDVANLSFDIGVAYNPDVVIQPIEYTATASQKPESYSALIDNTYEVQKAQKNLETAILERDDAYREYKENDNVGTKVSTYALEQHDYQVKAAEETIASTKDDLETKIEGLYHNEELSYFSYEEAVRKLEDANKDLKAVQTRYKLGFVSKHDYESALLKLDQAKLNVYTATMKTYLAQQSIKAVETGYIQ